MNQKYRAATISPTRKTKFQLPLVFEYSAGGVVLHDRKCLLIRTRDLKDHLAWTFPKGQLHEHETSLQAAIREVEEETGWRCRIESELPKSEYWFHRGGKRVKKTVRWFRMVPIEEVGQPDREVEEAAWVPTKEAKTWLTYRSERELLEKAITQLKVATTPGGSLLLP